MSDAFPPVVRQNLSDRLAQRIRSQIQNGEFCEGDRLPAIMEMARRFGVGHPTVREALKKLQTVGIVEIRHGSGVYVTSTQELFVLASPDFTGGATKKRLLDLMQVRIPLEVLAAAEAARLATREQIADMKRLLSAASRNTAKTRRPEPPTLEFHRKIAIASGNVLLAQILDALQKLFGAEQRSILDARGSRERDFEQHADIMSAIERRDAKLAGNRMREHLAGVQDAFQRWDPATRLLADRKLSR